MVKAKGGNFLHVGPLEIRIGCHKGIPINYDSSLNEHTKTYPVRIDRPKIMLSFDVLGLSSANPYCSIWNYEFIKSDNTPDLTKLIRPFD